MFVSNVYRKLVNRPRSPSFPDERFVRRGGLARIGYLACAQGQLQREGQQRFRECQLCLLC